MPSNFDDGAGNFPSIIAFDYETALTDGTPSIKYYWDNFRVVSVAFSWYMRDGSIASKFVRGEENILPLLVEIGEHPEVTLLVYNLQFELGCTLFRFPGTAEKFRLVDVMRLVQLYDNGNDTAPLKVESIYDELDRLESGEEGTGKPGKPNVGFRLVAAIARILPREFHNHKAEAYNWLAEHGVKKGTEGSNLHLLPEDIFIRYNVADSDNTLRLYTSIATKFTQIQFDWTKDHTLYKVSVSLLIKAEAKGVLVDRPKLEKYHASIACDIAAIELAFREAFSAPIAELERSYEDKAVSTLKTEKGQAKRRAKYALDPVVFNIGSNKQLGDLAVTKLGMVPQFFTDKGSPSFKSALLTQWGQLGELLLNRRKRFLVYKQAGSLLALSERDGRYHIQLKAAGTVTGRYAGGTQD